MIILYVLNTLVWGEGQLTVPAIPKGTVVGIIDTRPSYSMGEKEFREETFLEAGYKIQNVSLSLAHNFYLRFSSQTEPIASLYRSVDGYGRLRVDNILELNNKTLSFSYEGRLYGPFDEISPMAGQVTMFRNYFKVRQKLGSQFSVGLAEVPIFIMNHHAGYTDAKGKVIANPFFENRLILMPEWTYKRLNIAFPIMFHATRHSGFRADAENNDNWSYFFWIYPEITYQLDSKSTVGLAFYSDNFFNADFDGLSTDGFLKGVPQLFFTTSL